MVMPVQSVYGYLSVISDIEAQADETGFELFSAQSAWVVLRSEVMGERSQAGPCSTGVNTHGRCRQCVWSWWLGSRVRERMGATCINRGGKGGVLGWGGWCGVMMTMVVGPCMEETNKKRRCMLGWTGVDNHCAWLCLWVQKGFSSVIYIPEQFGLPVLDLLAWYVHLTAILIWVMV